ncbi:MAG: NifU N-terminal domain-containing protein, partial [Mesorhizobium sp.]
MFIQTEATDNPSRLRFLPGRPVVREGVMEFADRQQAAVSPLAARLFDVEGVSALAFGPDSITITKKGGDWQRLKPALLGVIMEHFMSGAPVMREPVARPAARPAQAEANGLVEEVRTSLRQVIDPELGYNIVDLGLIYDVSVGDDGAVLVSMTTTTPGCPATSYLMEGARECTSAVTGVETVEVELTYEPRWSPEMMSDDAKA